MERVYIGVDLHKVFFQACAVNAMADRLWEGRFPRTLDGFARFAPRLGASAAVAVEACGPTWPFVDQVVATGAHVCVVDPRKTKLKAGYAAKTDRLDARRLADALRRDSVVSIYVPPPAIRELRELCRSRHQLVRLRTRVVQMLRALLLRSGHADAPMRCLYGPAGPGVAAPRHTPRGCGGDRAAADARARGRARGGRHRERRAEGAGAGRSDCAGAG